MAAKQTTRLLPGYGGHRPPVTASMVVVPGAHARLHLPAVGGTI